VKYWKADRIASRNPFTVIAAAGILAVIVVGCAATPVSHFYTLSATSAPVAKSSELSVAVGPVSIPAVVDRPQIVVSTGPNQVRLEEFNRWAGPLQNNIARVVAENLTALLGTPRVTLFSQSTSGEVEYRVLIDVQRFDSVPGQAAMLDAVWSVRRTKDGKVETGRTTVRERVQASDYNALAAGHSRAVARLSQDIASAVRALDHSGSSGMGGEGIKNTSNAQSRRQNQNEEKAPMAKRLSKRKNPGPLVPN
jgi:uncharacterized lipoprotein YmbA